MCQNQWEYGHDNWSGEIFFIWYLVHVKAQQYGMLNMLYHSSNGNHNFLRKITPKFYQIIQP